MRLAATPKSLAVAFIASAAIALFELAVRDKPNGLAPAVALQLALSVVALGCAARLTLPFRAPDVGARFGQWRSAMLAVCSRLRAFAGRVRFRGKASRAPARPRVSAPYALPARVAVALAAAARARK